MDISSATTYDKCEGPSTLYTHNPFDKLDTASTELSETPYEGPNQFYKYKPFGKLDTASAVPSDTPYENIDDLCTYNSFDILNTCSIQTNDPTLIGPEGTPCKFIHFGQSNSLQEYDPSDILQCDGADTISDISCNDSMSSYNSEEEADSLPVHATLVPSAVQGPAGAPL